MPSLVGSEMCIRDRYASDSIFARTETAQRCITTRNTTPFVSSFAAAARQIERKQNERSHESNLHPLSSRGSHRIVLAYIVLASTQNEKQKRKTKAKHTHCMSACTIHVWQALLAPEAFTRPISFCGRKIAPSSAVTAHGSGSCLLYTSDAADE